MYTLWTTEVEYWKEDLRARTTRKRTSSARPDGKEKMSTFTTVAHAAASVCIAGVVILSAAWAAYKKRSRTPNTSSTNHEEHVGGDVPATRALAVYGRGMGSAPAFSRDLRLLLLRAVVEEETTPSPSTQRVIAQALEPVPAVSLSGLVNSDGLSLHVPLLVGVDSVSKELWLLVVPTPEFAASLLRLFEQQNGGVALLSEEAPASNTTLPLLLCGAGGAEGPKETGAEDMGAVLAMVQLLGSTPKIAAWLASSSPSTSSRDGDGKDLSSLSDESLLVRPTLWGATIKNPSSAATLDLEDSLSPTSSLGQTPTNLEGFVGPVLALEVEGKPVSPQSASCKGGNNDRGGGRVMPAATVPIESEARSVGAGTTSPAPRSILVTSKGSVSARRVAAVARGVRWLDIVQEEEQQASNRRRRAIRWAGGAKKRQPPPTAPPRASRARAFA